MLTASQLELKEHVATPWVTNPGLYSAAEASAEFEDATRWYEKRHAGLGLAFLAAVDATVESLVRWPRAGALIDEAP